MPLIKTIENDYLVSLRERQSERTGVLRMIRNGLKNFAIAKRMPEFELTDEQVVGVLRQEAKKRKESIEAFTAGGRKELADKEQRELEIVSSYLPAELPADEISAIIKEVIEERKIVPPFKLGAVMGPVIQKIAGRASGEAIKTAVEQYIAEG